MTPDKDRRDAPRPFAKDTLLLQFEAELLPPDSPEFQERARLPWRPHGQALAPDEPKPDEPAA